MLNRLVKILFFFCVLSSLAALDSSSHVREDGDGLLSLSDFSFSNESHAYYYELKERKGEEIEPRRLGRSSGPMSKSLYSLSIHHNNDFFSLTAFAVREVPANISYNGSKLEILSSRSHPPTT
jgi:hypothetical protein